jgi:hypothetical protein
VPVQVIVVGSAAKAETVQKTKLKNNTKFPLFRMTISPD